MRSRVVVFLSAVVALGALITIGSASARGGVPDSVNYQGVLKTSVGSPVPDGSYSVTFNIYDVTSGPNPPLWTETKSVTTVGGLFTTFLGSVTALPSSVFSGPKRFLGITVNPDPEMTPRVALVTVPYSFRVETVDGSAGGAISGDVTVSAGNLNLDPSTATAGNILKGGALFIHSSGTDNTFIGTDAGNLTMTGTSNTASGFQALYSNTTGHYNTAGGFQALYSNTTGISNTASGQGALASNTSGNDNTACGVSALLNDTSGQNNTANGVEALYSNTSGSYNTASGRSALYSNTTGSYNTAIGYGANVSAGDLTNATAIGNGAVVNASNNIRLGNTAVTVIEGQVAYTFTSDRTQKENFRPVDGDEVLRKIRGLSLMSWNLIGQDPQQFRHYGPVAQEFFAAFGHDGLGTSGAPTTINSGDMAGILMIAVQTLTRENELMKAENANLRTRLETLEQLVTGTRTAGDRSTK